MAEEVKNEEMVQEEVQTNETPETTAENTEENQTENTEVTSEEVAAVAPRGREKLILIVKEKNPEINVEDDEAIADYLSQMIEENSAYSKEIDNILEAGKKNPMYLKALGSLAQNDPVGFIVSAVGIENIKAAIEDPENAEKLAQAQDDYIKRISESDTFEEEYNKNLGNSIKELEGFATDKGLSEDQAVAILVHLDGISKKAVLGLYDKEDFDNAYKALNFDSAMETKEAEVVQARTEGEIAGKNAKIEEKLKKGEELGSLPTGQGGVATSEQPTKKKVIIDIPNLMNGNIG